MFSCVQMWSLTAWGTIGWDPHSPKMSKRLGQWPICPSELMHLNYNQTNTTIALALIRIKWMPRRASCLACLPPNGSLRGRAWLRGWSKTISTYPSQVISGSSICPIKLICRSRWTQIVLVGWTDVAHTSQRVTHQWTLIVPISLLCSSNRRREELWLQRRVSLLLEQTLKSIQWKAKAFLSSYLALLASQLVSSKK